MKRILIIEDDDLQRSNLESMIRSLDPGYVTFGASNEKDALNIAGEQQIDLFLIDVNLKKESGIDLARKIRAADKYQLTWIVFLTGHVQYMLEAFKDIHCYDYLLKPIDIEVLKELLETLLRKNRQTGVSRDAEASITLDLGRNVFTKVYLKDIVYIEIYYRSLNIYTIDDMFTVRNISLQSMLEQINGSDIIQTHKAFAVNIRHIEKIENNVITFKNRDGKAVIGDKYRKNVMNQMLAIN